MTKTGRDRPIATGASLTVLNAIREARKEAQQAKRTRLIKNRINMNAYLGEQDWSHKTKGQSREFLPKTPVAVEQFAAFIKRALTQFGDWFSVDIGKNSNFPFQDFEVKELLKSYLGNLADGFRKSVPFTMRVSDAMKVGLLEGLIVFKVHGYKVAERTFRLERGINFINSGNGKLPTSVSEEKVVPFDIKPWRLAIDIVRGADYFPDPTERAMYEIHTAWRDIHEVEELASQGIYDSKVIDGIREDFAADYEQYQKEQLRNQDRAVKPSYRKKIRIDEYWGDMVNEDGRLVERNVLSAMANDKYLIRPPEPNPLYHGGSPFVASPLIRVPDSVWHKALFDHASPLNLALNELSNLMLDGGLSSVWGTKQIRLGWLEDPRQVSGGIPQGTTLAIKDEVPVGAQVMERVDTGQVPPTAMAIFTLFDREFNASALTNDLKLGLLPPKQVKATEIIEIQQSQGVTLDGIIADIEPQLIGETLRKAWLTILQNADDLDIKQVIPAIGSRAALMLSRMSQAERIAFLGHGYTFRVHGLSATLMRARDFQKHMAFMQGVIQNPLLFQAFARRFSADKELTFLMKSLNINPDTMEMTEEEKATAGQRMEELQKIAQMFGMGQKGQSAELTGEPQLPAEINQAANPMTGMAGS